MAKKTTPRQNGVNLGPKTKSLQITKEMNSQGITTQTISYLSNPTFRLKSLNLQEFIYLWVSVKNTFEQSDYFKSNIQKFVELIETTFDISSESFQVENPKLKYFLEVHAPLKTQLKMPQSFRSLAEKLLDETLSRIQLSLIFDQMIKNFSSEVDIYDLIIFSEKAQGDDYYEKIANAFLDLKLIEDFDPHNYSREIMIGSSEQRRKNFCTMVVYSDNEDYYYDLAEYFVRTRDSIFIEAMIQIIENDSQGMNNKKYAIYKSIRNLAGRTGITKEDWKACQELLLPVTLSIASRITGGAESNASLEDQKLLLDGIYSLMNLCEPNKDTKRICAILLDKYFGVDKTYYKCALNWYELDGNPGWITLFCRYLENDQNYFSTYNNVYVMLEFNQLVVHADKNKIIINTFLNYQFPEISSIDDRLVKILDYGKKANLKSIRSKVIKMLPALLSNENNRENFKLITEYVN